MNNSIFMETLVGDYKQPDTGNTVEVYNYNASDVSGGSPNGTKIDDMTEIPNTGIYEVDFAESKKVTVTSNTKNVAGLIGILFNGDKALDDSVDTTAIEDAAVTAVKTDFAY